MQSSSQSLASGNLAEASRSTLRTRFLQDVFGDEFSFLESPWDGDLVPMHKSLGPRFLNQSFVKGAQQQALRFTGAAYGKNQSDPFRTLAKYIGVFGTPENESKSKPESGEKIEMTAPVITETSESKVSKLVRFGFWDLVFLGDRFVGLLGGWR